MSLTANIKKTKRKKKKEKEYHLIQKILVAGMSRLNCLNMAAFFQNNEFKMNEIFHF